MNRFNAPDNHGYTRIDTKIYRRLTVFIGLFIFISLPSMVFAGGKGFVEGERIDELIFAVGYGPQGGEW